MHSVHNYAETKNVPSKQMAVVRV